MGGLEIFRQVCTKTITCIKIFTDVTKIEILVILAVQINHIFQLQIQQHYCMKLQVNNDYAEGKPRQPLYKEVSPAPELTLTQRTFQNLQKPNIRIYCSNCELDISRYAQICTHNDHYCIACFSNLEEYPAQYIVRPSLKRSFTYTNWDLMDEVILTTAFRLWGYSNWRQIQDFMDYNQSPFTLDEIKQHYEDYHYFQPKHLISVPKELPKALPHTPYSELSLKKYQESPLKDISLRRNDSKGQKKPSSQRNISVDNQGDRGSRPASMGNISAHENDGRQLSTYFKTESSVLGYNAKRGEFETCYYDVQAEKMLDDLEFYDNDTPEEFALKIEMIEEYNRRLDERAKRKEFVLDYKLLDSHGQLPQSQEQQQATLLFQPLMRFTVNYQEYRQMVDAFSTIKKEQTFITNLVHIRNKVSQAGTLQGALQFLTKKRQKSKINWEARFGKKFQDKRRRKVYVRSTLEDGTVVLKEENEHDQYCPISFLQISSIAIQDIDNNSELVTRRGKEGRRIMPLEAVLKVQRSEIGGNEGLGKDKA